MVTENYPFKNNYFNLSGIKYHYVDEGEGDPIIMLHGNPTWSFYYRRLINSLKDSYRIIVPDHIGCGLSDKPDNVHYSYTLEQRVYDLEALLSHLEIKRNITLVMHDWGGMIGMLFAARHPDEVKRFIIMNTAAFHLPETKKFPWQLRLCRKKGIGDFFVRRLNLFCIAATYLCSTTPLSKDIRKAYRAPYNSYNNRIAILRFVQDIPLVPGDPSYLLVDEVEKSLTNISDKPMLIFWGEKDFVFDHHFLHEWLRRFPNAEVHRYPNAGHFVLEDAYDDIIIQIKKFLEENNIS